MWNAETGAGVGQLDHGLRKSSRLRETTEELLQELTAISDEGWAPRNVQHLVANFDIALLLVQGISKDGEGNDGRAPEYPEVWNRDNSVSSEPGSLLSSSSIEVPSPLHQMITEMHDVLNCLLREVPSLQDPAPHDARMKDDYEGAFSADLSHLQSKYPQANEELLNRLGVANWKRRQQLMSIRAQDKGEEIAIGLALKIGTSATSEDNDNDTSSAAETSQYSDVHSIGLQSQITDEWTAFSGTSSTMPTAITSMTGDPVPVKPSLAQPAEKPDSHRLRLPRPPKPNSMFEGEQFECPYCSFELVEVASLAIWK